MYITLAQLAEQPGATELSQVASPEHLAALVDPVLLDLTLRAGDRSGYDSDAITDADATKTRIEGAISCADELIDAHLARRVSVPRAVPGVLVRIARALARYDLHKHLIGDERNHPVLRDYRESLRLLEAIRDGKVTLGIDDPAAASESSLGEVRFETTAPVFSRSAGVR